MRIVANIISYIFHPLILVYVLVVTSYWIDKYGYYITDERAIGAMLIMDFFLLVMFPVLGIAMLVGLKMISGFKMEMREDRIGPLIITLAFYIWFFVNVNNNTSYPDSLRFVALGATISVGLAFFINNFSKISLHAIGGTSICVALIFLLIDQKDSFIDIEVLFIGGYRLSALLVIFFFVLMAGCIGWARLYLRAHSNQEVYGGYLVGIVAQIIAFGIIM